MSDPSDDRRLDLIARALIDCGQDVTVEEVSNQFRYETAREPHTTDVERAIRRNGGGE